MEITVFASLLEIFLQVQSVHRIVATSGFDRIPTYDRDSIVAWHSIDKQALNHTHSGLANCLPSTLNAASEGKSGLTARRALWSVVLHRVAPIPH